MMSVEINPGDDLTAAGPRHARRAGVSHRTDTTATAPQPRRSAHRTVSALTPAATKVRAYPPGGLLL